MDEEFKNKIEKMIIDLGAPNPDNQQEYLGLMSELAFAICEEVGSLWQADTANDIVARGMITSARFHIEGIRTALEFDSKGINPMMMQVALTHYEAVGTSLATLEQIGQIRKQT